MLSSTGLYSVTRPRTNGFEHSGSVITIRWSINLCWNQMEEMQA